MKKTMNVLMYVLIFSFGMVIVSLGYPYIERYAMAHRMSAVPGGEMLLWLLPFMVCVGISTARMWRKGSKR